MKTSNDGQLTVVKGQWPVIGRWRMTNPAQTDEGPLSEWGVDIVNCYLTEDPGPAQARRWTAQWPSPGHWPDPVLVVDWLKDGQLVVTQFIIGNCYCVDQWRWPGPSRTVLTQTDQYYWWPIGGPDITNPIELIGDPVVLWTDRRDWNPDNWCIVWTDPVTQTANPAIDPGQPGPNDSNGQTDNWRPNYWQLLWTDGDGWYWPSGWPNYCGPVIVWPRQPVIGWPIVNWYWPSNWPTQTQYYYY